MNLLIDFINKEGSKGYTTRGDKIYYNLSFMGVLEQCTAQLKENKEATFSFLTLFGRWIIVYLGNVTNNEQVMHIIDFRTELKTEYREGFFSQEIMETFADIQMSYRKAFTKDSDFIALTHAEPCEKVLKPNLFVCESSDMVFQKAETLGILTTVENMSQDDEMKVLIAEEKIIVENNDVTNLYAIINFEGSEYGYLKIYDLHNNLERFNDFQTSIELMGIKFDRSFALKYFTKEVLN